MVYRPEGAAMRQGDLSRKAGRRKIEPAGPKVGAQRRRRFLTRVQETAADIKTRP